MVNSRRGFTLIELLVVIAIIALLLAILMPSLTMAKEHAKSLTCRTNFKTIGVAIHMYCDNNDGKLMTNADSGHPYTAFRGDKSYASGPKGRTPMKLGLLYETGLIETGEIFYCPSNRQDGALYKSYTTPGEWGTLPQDYNGSGSGSGNNWVRTGCSYYPQSRRSTQAIAGKEYSGVASVQSNLSPTKSMVTDIIWSWGGIAHTKNSKPRAFNAVFGDGHVTSTVDSNPQEVFDSVYSGVLDYDLWFESAGNSRTIRPEDDKYFHIILGLLEP